MDPEIVVVDYGMGNIHSILKALRLYSKNIIFTGDPEKIRKADALVLPGDGAFRAAMQGLGEARKAALLEAVATGTPLLGICIGFQILFSDSKEDGPCEGLGLLPGRIRRFSFADASVRIPHMGWNRLEFIEPADTNPNSFLHKWKALAFGHTDQSLPSFLPQRADSPSPPPQAKQDQQDQRNEERQSKRNIKYKNPYVYFIHSYRAEDVPEALVVAHANYAGDFFPAIVKKDNILAMQFHPEKSEQSGLSMIEAWVRGL